MSRNVKPTTDLDQYDEDKTDLELQNRGMRAGQDGRVDMTLYAWLSDRRKAENRGELAKCIGRFCPFSEGEKVSKTYRGLKLTGKIDYIDRDYYGGDCLVLAVKLDKRSSRKWTERTGVNNTV